MFGGKYMSMFYPLDVMVRGSETHLQVVNPLAAGAAYIRVFIF